MFPGFLHYLFFPEGGLDFANMGFAKEEHADTGLPDASPYSIGKLFLDNGLLEWELCPFGAASFF